MSTLDTLRELVRHANVAATARVVRQGETDQTDRAYARCNGAPDCDIAPGSRHPFEGMRSPPGRASGAYQYLASTWGDFVKWARSQGAEPDFSPPWQDIGFVWLLWARGALDLVLAGEIPAALAKLRPTWTSLPGASENSGRYTLDKALAIYRQYGGAIATQAAAPIEEASTTTEGPMPAPDILKSVAGVAGAINPIAGLVLGLAGSLMEAFSPLAKEKIAKEVNRHTDDPSIGATVAGAVVDIAKQLTGHDDPIQAVAAVQAKPELVQKVQEQTLAKLDELAPYLDKVAEYERSSWEATESSMDRAQARAAASGWEMAKPLVWWALGAASAILLGLFSLAGVYAYKGVAVPEMLLTLIVQTVTGILGFVAMLFAFRFGTSKSSGAKDELVAQLASRRPK